MENLPQTTCSNASSPRSQEKKGQIYRLVHQCFAIQDTYGKKPQQLDILMDAMVEDLSGFPLEAVRGAFIEWRRTATKIPTPADMLRLAEEQLQDARFSSENTVAVKPAPRTKGHGVPWAFKFWKDFTEQDKSALREHLRTLPAEKKKNYVLYLKSYIGVPKEYLA